MKLRDLGPGMAVHCQTEEQAKEYCRQLKLAGLCDYATYYFPFRKYGSELCFLIDLSQSARTTYSTYANLEYAQEETLEVVEFTDLEFDTSEKTEEKPMKDLNKVFAENVFQVCNEKEINITAFAKEHCLNRIQVYRANNGEASPTLGTVQKWANALGVPAMELLKE